jgi:acyl-CoA reductase-like NAD-dependent aldehyde dehydrogenase
MKIINPATHELIKEIPEDNAKAIEEKYQRARQAQSSWEKIDLDFRIAAIQHFHDLLKEHQDHLANLLSQEVGKPLDEAISEISGARGRINFFIENARKWLTPEVLHQDGNTTDLLAFNALGVICNISAWNYPFLVGVNVFIPALVAGNAVLYKPSEYATLTGLEIERLMHLAGIPQDIFISVTGGAVQGETLLNLPCDGYFFTGSYNTGKYIAEKVAPKLVPVGLELGGKDPLYVTDNIKDMQKTAASVAEGSFYNNGQSCCAVERVYVHEKVYQEFIEQFIREANKIKVGAVTRSAHIAHLEHQVQDAVTKGAKLLTGGKKTGAGNFFEPTVLVDVTHKMSVMRDETFGPLIGVMKVKSDAEAVQLMNDTNYGLTAAVYCEDSERAKQILNQVDAGTSYINCCDRVSPYLPWSGRKNSGLGSTLSYLGILAFAKPRGWHIRA